MTDICLAIRALVKFDISNNSIQSEGTKAFADALKDNQVMTELNLSSNEITDDGNYGTDMSGVIAIGNAIPTMGAMTSLDISANSLGAEGAKHVAAAIPKCK